MSAGMMDFESFKHEQDETDAIVRYAFKMIARETGRKEKELIRAFKNHDETVTCLFWMLIEATFPEEFNRVYFCDGCKKFHMFHDGGESPLTDEAIREIREAVKDVPFR